MSIDTTDFLAGDQYFRPNWLPFIGGEVPEHDHPFPHAVIVPAGWCLLRLYDRDGGIEREWQLAAVEHAKLRRIAAVRRPIRLPDHRILGIGPNDPVPDGGAEIPFKPVGYWGEVLAHRKHKVIALADESAICCANAYRDPNTGGKIIAWNGYIPEPGSKSPWPSF